MKQFSDTDFDLQSTLVVIDRLEVGAPKIERRKIKVPYTIRQGEITNQFDFEYSFEEDVFEPDNPAAVNLASVMGAQVAINYGLFCREIVFAGSFDKHDRKFIRDMAANTAREIFVMKFLHTNPFLVGDAAQLPVVKRNSYCFAELVFKDEISPKRQQQEKWGSDGSRHAVLSSGGKDSLVSFGLLKEMGLETHPVFVNESGRHWYTALNGYRYMKKNFVETARVWTNSDRLFNWMLRHLPFVRKDFAQVRSDEYPIRLWTVAVFLFGVLPILRKRAIGRLIIGDEFDTTVRTSYKGITHYNGLFDQSRFFDNALTRYFSVKGWSVSQFSLIRPLSELLIEKVLAERYPELLRHQTSCHATHIENERVYPCGKCEKCRRIVGMLLAIDADPRHCGYTESQIEQCLKELEKRGVHQEAVGAKHLIYLLSKKGLIKAKKAGPQALVMKIRIDPDRSPVDSVPGDLRAPLFRLFMQHAEGTVLRKGRAWVDFDLQNDPAMDAPYAFQKKAKSRTLENAANSRTSFMLGELTWPEAEALFEQVDIAMLPVGAVEQHGPHLPLDTDAFDAAWLAAEIASRCTDPKPLVLPLIPYGVSYHHEDFKGTFSVTNETLAQFVYEIGRSAARNGITKLVIINGHGGNSSTLQFAAQMINRDTHIFTCVDTGETSDADINAMAETQNDVHAGEIETSTSLAIRPHLVKMEKAEKFVPQFSSRYLNFSSSRSVEWNARTSKISESGVLGDPTKASAEKGRKMLDVMIRNLVEFVEQLKGMSLEEIYESRY